MIPTRFLIAVFEAENTRNSFELSLSLNLYQVPRVNDRCEIFGELRKVLGQQWKIEGNPSLLVAVVMLESFVVKQSDIESFLSSAEKKGWTVRQENNRA